MVDILHLLKVTINLRQQKKTYRKKKLSKGRLIRIIILDNNIQKI